jgi:glucose-6-phosphate dehydrogenase assembly protein OpcA
VRLPLDAVEREMARLWGEEARQSHTPRMGLLTLVALASEPGLVHRAQQAMREVAQAHPSRTVVAAWTPGAPAAITADVALHRAGPDAPACGDAITLEAVGGAREWLPEAVDRLALPDLPICMWWVGDLPDHDHLFDRMVAGADMVVVNSEEMDLRDLETLSSIADRSRDRYALADLTWIRLRSLRDLVARFFDDEAARVRLPDLERVHIAFAPRPGELDVPSAQALLLFGWTASVLSLEPDGVRWTRGDGWAEALLGSVAARFEPRPRSDVAAGSIQYVAFECGGAHFEIERQADPRVFRWLREVPGAPVSPQMLRVEMHEETALLVRCLEHQDRDRLLETSLRTGSRIARPIAPRLSLPPEI